MKLIFIYGPPAVGKLTVGQELKKLTGYKLFHNHLTVLVARSLFPGHHGAKPPVLFSKLLKKMRLAAIEVAAEGDIDTIFTLAYSGAVDDPFIEKVIAAVKKHGGSVHFVQLTAPDDVLLQRVSAWSRMQIAKISDPSELRELLDSRDLHATVPHHRVLKIDTSVMSAADAAKEIATHLKLTR